MDEHQQDTIDLAHIKNKRVNQNHYVDLEYSRGLSKKGHSRLGKSMDMTNKQMLHLQQELGGMVESGRQGVGLKKAAGRVLEGQGECKTGSSVQMKQTEEEFDQFVQQNPSVNYFLQKQLQGQEGNKEKVKQRLMKYFFDNVEYFKHLVGKCKCFSCGCGHCKCNFVHRNVTDNYGTIYKNQYKKGGLKGVNELFLNQNNPVRKPEQSIGTKPIESPQKMHEGTNNNELYASPNEKDYVKKVRIHEPIPKEPQLTQLSNYQLLHMETVKQPKEIQMIRTHNIVQNTPLVGRGTTTYNHQHLLIQPPQAHHKVINIDNPLKTSSYQAPVQNVSRMTNQELQQNKREKIYQQDNHAVQSFATPNHFKSNNERSFLKPEIATCVSKLK